MAKALNNDAIQALHTPILSVICNAHDNTPLSVAEIRGILQDTISFAENIQFLDDIKFLT